MISEEETVAKTQATQIRKVIRGKLNTKSEVR